MATTTRMGEQDLQATVERIRPVIEQYRDEAEQERRLPEGVVTAMQKEGLFKLLLPKELGGAETDLLTYYSTIEKVSSIDSSAGWTFANVATSAVQAALLPEAGAQEVFGVGAVTAGSVIPGGRATPVEGGYRVSGRWPLASGCHHAAWLGGNSFVFEGEALRMGPGGAPDFVSGGIFGSTDRVLIDDLNTFLSPRKLDLFPGDPGYDGRWDIEPFSGIFDGISIADINKMLGGATANPKMFGGAKALGGPRCTGL